MSDVSDRRYPGRGGYPPGTPGGCRRDYRVSFRYRWRLALEDSGAEHVRHGFHRFHRHRVPRLCPRPANRPRAGMRAARLGGDAGYRSRVRPTLRGDRRDRTLTHLAAPARRTAGREDLTADNKHPRGALSAACPGGGQSLEHRECPGARRDQGARGQGTDGPGASRAGGPVAGYASGPALFHPSESMSLTRISGTLSAFSSLSIRSAWLLWAVRMSRRCARDAPT